MGKTEDNLAAAFAGESQANRKYLAFAKQADKEGYPQVAKLFRAAAAAETVHAHAHLKTLGGIKGTGDNLQEAIAVEEVHAGLYQKAFDNLENLQEDDYYVCSVCGYTCEKDAPDKCPVCGAAKKAFSKVD